MQVDPAAVAETVADKTDGKQLPAKVPQVAVVTDDVVHVGLPAAFTLHAHVPAVGNVHGAEEPRKVAIVIGEEVIADDAVDAEQGPVTVPQDAFVVDEHVGAAPSELHVSEHVPAVGNPHATVAVRIVPEFAGLAAVAETAA